jgi:hypothetical protein
MHHMKVQVSAGIERVQASAVTCGHHNKQANTQICAVAYDQAPCQRVAKQQFIDQLLSLLQVTGNKSSQLPGVVHNTGLTHFRGDVGQTWSVLPLLHLGPHLVPPVSLYLATCSMRHGGASGRVNNCLTHCFGDGYSSTRAGNLPSSIQAKAVVQQRSRKTAQNGGSSYHCAW